MSQFPYRLYQMDQGVVVVGGLQYMLRQSAHIIQSNHQGWFWHSLSHKTKPGHGVWATWTVVFLGSAWHSQPGTHCQARLSPSLRVAAWVGDWRHKVEVSSVTAEVQIQWLLNIGGFKKQHLPLGSLYQGRELEVFAIYSSKSGTLCFASSFQVWWSSQQDTLHSAVAQSYNLTCWARCWELSVARLCRTLWMTVLPAVLGGGELSRQRWRMMSAAGWHKPMSI